MNSVSQNLERVREQIAHAAAKAGRIVEDVELVAITKTHPAEKAREAIEAGQTLFGESRVQEARAKIPELPSNLRWHFVGHVQKNKIRHALPLFEMIHSVDSLGVAQETNRIAGDEGMHPRVLLEVNASRKYFVQLRELRDRLQTEFRVDLPQLSMGMTQDFPIAVEEGATLVRVGTAIFGERRARKGDL